MAATSSSVGQAVTPFGLSDDRKEPEGIGTLPVEVLLQIFSYLSQRDLENTRKCCRLWRCVSSDESLMPLSLYLRVKHPELPVSVIDDYSWKKHVNLEEFGLSVDDAPELDKKTTVEKLKELFGKTSIEWGTGGTLILMPKGLTLKKIIDIGKASKHGPEFKFRHIGNEVINQFRDDVVRESYWMWMANGVIGETRNKTPEEQNRILTEIECEKPGVLEATTIVVITYMISHGCKRLFDWDGETFYNADRPDPRAITYTSCREKIDGRWHSVVGGLSPAGLCIDYDIHIFFDDYSFAGLGVSPSRKF